MPETFFYISSGEITNPKAVRDMIGQLADGRYLMKVQNKNKRTINQNSYLHGVLIPEFRMALNSVGYDEVKNDDQAKMIMKSMFLTAQVVNVNTGEMISYVKDTHTLTTIEMSTLFDEVIKFCAENMNYQIAYPNEQLIINYEPIPDRPKNAETRD